MINTNGIDFRCYRYYLPVVVPWHNVGMHVMYNVPIPIKIELDSKYLIENLIEDYELGNLESKNDNVRQFKSTKKTKN